MIFSRRKLDSDFNLSIANTPILRKHEARFLGVIIDDKLTWTKHIKTLKSKMSRYIGIMYKIKYLLPLQARMQIFHSFVQSHLNFCSIVWGFSSKTNIESLFTNQKKGMRAVMPGYVNLFYKDGCPPAHTKPAFTNFKVLTVQGVIAKNALIFMHKVNQFPFLLPDSVRNTISPNTPGVDSNFDSSHEWLAEFGTHVYNKSIFFKGPLIYIDSIHHKPLTASACLSIKAYKSTTTRTLLEIQSSGQTEEWQADNFLLYNIKGLRRSSRLNNMLS